MSFFCDPGDNSPLSPEAAECKDVSVETFSEVGHLSLTRDQLIVEQKNDATLSPLFEAAGAGDKVESGST